jgi:hypothetical protein
MASPRSEGTAAVLGRLENKIDNLSEQVGDIKQKIYGNGHPGLVIDQERQNANIQKLLTIAESNERAIKELKAETTTKFLARNWRTLLMVAVAFFLFLHSIIPADMSLWSWFSKFFGGG